MFDRLGARFDRFYFPSEEEDDGKKMIADLIKRGIAVDGRPDEAVIVELDETTGEKKEKYRVLVVLRSDGTSLCMPHMTCRWLSRNSLNTIWTNRSMWWMFANRYTSSRFSRPSKLPVTLGRERCYHLAYEIVNLPGNVTMSSRDGTVVLLEDLLREAVDRAVGSCPQEEPELYLKMK